MNGSGSKTFKELFLYPKGRKTKIQETMDKVFGRVIEKKDVVRELPARLSVSELNCNHDKPCIHFRV
jgi:hypothetical protein